MYGVRGRGSDEGMEVVVREGVVMRGWRYW